MSQTSSLIFLIIPQLFFIDCKSVKDVSLTSNLTTVDSWNKTTFQDNEEPLSNIFERVNAELLNGTIQSVLISPPTIEPDPFENDNDTVTNSYLTTVVAWNDTTFQKNATNLLFNISGGVNESNPTIQPPLPIPPVLQQDTLENGITKNVTVSSWNETTIEDGQENMNLNVSPQIFPFPIQEQSTLEGKDKGNVTDTDSTTVSSWKDSDFSEILRNVNKTVLNENILSNLNLTEEDPFENEDNANDTFITPNQTLPSSDSSVNKTKGFHHKISLDSEGDYILNWRFTETDITIRVEARTTGYVAFGLSRYGGMYPADVVIGWVKDGQGYLFDYHTIDNTPPILDQSQDWQLLSAEENQFGTSLEFRRRLDTCDPNDMKINEQTANLIFASHPNDPDDSGSVFYHGPSRRGHKMMSIPTQKTYYHCRISRTPEVEESHHFIAFEPVIQPGNEKFVHHVDFYACVDLDDSYAGYEFDCVEERIITSFCPKAYAILTKGIPPYQLPDHVGFPIGGVSDPKLFMIQIHYHNPELQSDVRDSSGVRAYYTRKLRQYDAGVLIAGMISNHINVVLPPSYEDFVSIGHCPSECLDQGIPDGRDGIQIVGVTHHAHLLGRRAITRHIRNGTELKPIAEDKILNFDFQGKLFVDEVTVRRGDTIRVDCTYDTSNKESFTYGGFSTEEEMCLSHVIYYPRMALDQCYSMPVYSQLGDDMHKVLPEIESWNYTQPEVRDHFQEVVMKSDYKYICQGVDYQTIWGRSPAPAILEPYNSPRSNCSESV
ncbi:hypothetical protein ScPMuIL_010141 [Solemya velum]